LSSGERENLITYLRFLGLQDRNGRITENGRNAEREGIVPMPEEGLYELALIGNWISVFGTKIIDFRRSESYGDIKGEPSALEEYQEIEETKQFTISDDEFSIKFLTNGQHPQVIILPEGEATVSVFCEAGKPAKGVISYRGGEIPLDLGENFDLRQNLNNLVEGWERGLGGRILEGLPMSFDEVRNDTGAISDGVLSSFDLGNQHIWFKNGDEAIVDEGDWNVELRNLKVVPKSMDDAKKWVSEAFYQYSKKVPAYHRSASAVHFVNDMIEIREYRNAFRTLSLGKDELQKVLRAIGHSEAVEEMRVADDLSPHERFFESQKVF
jgi:hypothetical protein